MQKRSQPSLLVPKKNVSFAKKLCILWCCPTCRRPAPPLSLTRLPQERLSADDLGVFHKVLLPRSCAIYFGAKADPHLPDVLEVP
jgi:hypothetical protein